MLCLEAEKHETKSERDYEKKIYRYIMVFMIF